MVYIPERGDIVWLNFDPRAGHEQAGRRPALVISPVSYNRKLGLALFCPITSRKKGYPFEVELPEGNGVSGVALADQIRNLDWKARKAEFAQKAESKVVSEVRAKLTTLI